MKPGDYKRIQKIVKKAHDNGWNPLPSYVDWKKVDIVYWVNDTHGIALLYTDKDGAATQWTKELNTVIFDERFAIALWGTEPGYISRVIKPNGGDYTGMTLPLYAIHLQQLAIASDKIKYLRDNT